jgi:hypothetical protein
MNRKNWTEEKLFFRLINNKTEKSYWENISELRKRKTKSIFEKSCQLVNSNIEKEKIIGIDILAQLGVTPRPFLKETMKLVFENLKKETNPKIIKSLLYAIGHNNEKLSKSEISLICSFKNSSENIVRESLVFSLLGVENNEAIETLIFLSNDKIYYIRDWATFGIGAQIEITNDKIINALWNRINDKNRDTKDEAILGLAKRKDKRIKKIIEKELIKDKFKSLLFEAIEELEDKELLKPTEEYLSKYEKEENQNPDWLNDIKNCIEKLKAL